MEGIQRTKNVRCLLLNDLHFGVSLQSRVSMLRVTNDTDETLINTQEIPCNVNARQFDHIIWDWNGTILDDLPLTVSIVNAQLTKNARLPMSLDEYRGCFTFPLRVFYRNTGLAGTEEEFMERNLAFFAEYTKKRGECTLHHGVTRVLDTFIENGGTHSILSAYAQNDLTSITKLFGIDSKFTHIKGADNLEGSSKVDEGHALLSLLEYKTSRILFVGDTMHDYEVACSLGVQCALIAKGHQSKEKLSSAQALLLDSHEELLSYL